MDLQEEIEKALNEYSKEVFDIVDKNAKKQAEETVKELKKTSPKKTGKYSKSWAKKDEKLSNVYTNSIVHNKKHYQLTHLLEKGHALRQGGRAKAYPHIEPSEEKAIKDFERKVRDDIKNL